MKWITSIFILLSVQSFAQVLDNRMGEAFTDKPFFNEDFIRTNRVKQLNGFYVYKKRGDVMRDTEFKCVYHFDSLGRLTHTYETRTDDGSKDTSWNFYQYNGSGRLIVHRKTDLDGFKTIEYSYDSLGRVIEERHLREIDTVNHQILRSILFNTERIEYADYGSQLKKTRYNNYDLPYLDEFTQYNDLGYLVERVEKIKMTSTIYTYAYEYNETGKLSAIRKSSNKKEGFLEELLFKYDELGNLTEKHLYKDGVFTTDIQIIYNDQSKLLSTVITKQVSTGFLMILRFKDYEFY